MGIKILGMVFQVQRIVELEPQSSETTLRVYMGIPCFDLLCVIYRERGDNLGESSCILERFMNWLVGEMRAVEVCIGEKNVLWRINAMYNVKGIIETCVKI